MSKTPLIERMKKGGAAKTWIREVESKDRRIERLLELKERYLNIIDLLAREKEQLTKYVEDSRYGYSVIKECHRELEAENKALKEKKITCPHCARFIMLTDEGRRMMAEQDALLTGGDDE